jgi:hypothetical protein
MRPRHVNATSFDRYAAFADRHAVACISNITVTLYFMVPA